VHQTTLASLAEPQIHKGRRLEGRASSVLVPTGDRFITRAVAEIGLDFEGVPGDSHAGWTRGADSRTPWYERGTPIRNVRQVSIVATDELEEIARRMELPEVRAEWLGANVVIDGVPRLSRLPAGTLIFFPSGATLRVEETNGPCRFAGASVAEHFPERSGLDMMFPQKARGLRGVVASVDRPGLVQAGDAVKISVPEQWILEG
jgi:hypothetical protein